MGQALTPLLAFAGHANAMAHRFGLPLAELTFWQEGHQPLDRDLLRAIVRDLQIADRRSP